jgi:hypothetical protein
MGFFKAFYNSFFNFVWLRSKKNSYGSAWSYFVLLVFFISSLSVLPSAIFFVKEFPSVKEKIEKNLPDFTAEFKDGELIVGALEQPFIYKENGSVVVVDTATNDRIGAEKYFSDGIKEIFLITRDEFRTITFGDDSKVLNESSTKWSFVSNETKINKQQIVKNFDFIVKPQMLALLFVVVLVVSFIVTFISSLLLVLAMSAIYWAILKNSNKIKFKQIMSVAMFAFTTPLVLSTATGMAISFSSILCVILFAVWMYIVLLKEAPKKI